MLFTFPSRYLFTIGRIGVLRLGAWSPHIQTKFHVFRPTQEYNVNCINTGLSPSTALFPNRFLLLTLYYWPGPRSLATTNGVSIDFLSSGYLDVSVPRVSPHTLCIQMQVRQKSWVFPFRNLRIKGYWHLPEAYRSLSRLSSPLCAKASTVCPYHTLIMYRNKFP